MDFVFRLQDMEFEWDVDKAQSNLQKHGVAFEEAAETFFDPFCRVGDASVESEPRGSIIGYNFAQRLLMTIFVERADRVRIISARPATPAERRVYYGYRKDGSRSGRSDRSGRSGRSGG